MGRVQNCYMYGLLQSGVCPGCSICPEPLSGFLWMAVREILRKKRGFCDMENYRIPREELQKAREWARDESWVRKKEYERDRG